MPQNKLILSFPRKLPELLTPVNSTSLCSDSQGENTKVIFNFPLFTLNERVVICWYLVLISVLHVFVSPYFISSSYSSIKCAMLSLPGCRHRSQGLKKLNRIPQPLGVPSGVQMWVCLNSEPALMTSFFPCHTQSKSFPSPKHLSALPLLALGNL